ncbi:FHA domain-containing protein [Haliangium sp.]|uniref:FHA domain-containing protein n=1 Tax=Haliangium sp. TaxID=2663208 RepID=UPI003D13B020
MAASSKTLLDIVESVRNRELSLSTPVLIDVGAKPEANSDASLTSLLTKTISQHDGWFVDYAKEYNDNPCYVLDAAHTITIGRSRSCDLRIAHKSVSSLHARLRFDRADLEYYLADQGSRNGTYVSGERIVPGVELPLWSGALLGFGRTAFLFLVSSTIRKLATLAL